MKNLSRFRIIFIALVALLSIQTISAQTDLFSKEYYIQNNDTLKYRMLLPKDFSESKKYPVVVFLHGAGERGDDNIKQLTHGSELFIKNRDSFPAIVLFPQCPEDDYWANLEIDRSTNPISLKFPKGMPPTTSLNLLMQLLEDMLQKPYVDKDKIYIGGLSMGGMGTFDILHRKPELFAGAFTICGAGNPETTELFAQKVPMWVFHGANDDVVNPQHSVDMVGGLLKYGGKPNFSLFAKDNHNSWDSAFAEPELLSWLFSNSKIH